MLHINHNILDEITRYEEGDLSGAERDAIARKLQTDEQYRRHQTYYRTIVGAIAKAALPLQQDVTGTEKEAIAQEIELFDKALDRDRRASGWRTTGLWLTLLAGLTAGSFWIGTQINQPKPPPPPIEESVKPVAKSKEAEEEILSSSGDTEQKIPADSVEWIRLERNGRVEYYLMIGQQVYPIRPDAGKQRLQEITDTAVLRLLGRQ